ncbi:MAG: aminotransferase class III-fold pyridoxal phosphate-dependent enzyme [Planctomycetota bacterium]
MPDPDPEFSLEEAAGIARSVYGLDGDVKLLHGEYDLNFRVRTNECDYVLKLGHPDNEVAILELQNQAIGLCEAVASFRSPGLVRSGKRQLITEAPSSSGETWYARCLKFVDGVPLASIEPNDPRRSAELWRAIGRCVAELDNALQPLNQSKAAMREFEWDLDRAPDVVKSGAMIREDENASQMLTWVLAGIESIRSRWKRLPKSVIHNDANDHNVILPPPRETDLTEDADLLPVEDRIGIIDFGDLVHSTTINNLAICLAYSVLDMDQPVDIAAQIASGYNSVRTLSEEEISVLFPLMCLRLAHSLTVAHDRMKEFPDNEYYAISQRPALETLKRLVEHDRDEVRELIRQRCRMDELAELKGETGGRDSLQERRRKSVAPSLSLSYERPLVIVKGRGQYLYDPSDITYLDCVNNVCHVGHCHPQVVAAAQQQIEQLNTNTRYLHENILELAEKLTATMPQPLEVCFFVNSGSEANDLALRLARNYTGNHDVCVIDNAYHGHVSSLIEISPYKFNSRGGSGKPDSTHIFPAPDTYRGAYKSTDAEAVEKYAQSAIGVLNETASSPAALIAEPILSCGGQVPLPPGYLKRLYPEIRKRGGLCISDEVQVGFGRVGTDYWGFQQQDVVPDIVTMGKPFGNGHPLAAVVTTREIADSFNNGMEYFNTFGGNPVSCAIGLAVMNVIEREELQQHALDTGQWLLDEWKSLQDKHSVIGDVRGSGLFLGIEFVEDRDTLKPATRLAKMAVNKLREKCILLSTDGPLENVIKFKPPMCFNKADGERVVSSLDKVVKELT